MNAGCEEPQRCRIVDVVVNEVLCLEHQGRDGDVDRSVGRHLGGAEPREVGLGVGVDAYAEVLSDVDVRHLGNLGQHGDLVGRPGSGRRPSTTVSRSWSKP